MDETLNRDHSNKTEQYFPVVLFITINKVVLPFVVTPIKAFHQEIPVALFVFLRYYNSFKL